MKHFVIIPLLCCLFLGNVSVFAQDSSHKDTQKAPFTGEGTPEEPFLIYTLEHLNWLHNSPNEWDKHYKQTADIDAFETQEWHEIIVGQYAGWRPVGNATTPFTGVYDGNGHIIEGLYINRTEEDNVGFFGLLNGAKIYRLGLKGVDITGKNRVGVIAGRSQNNSLIEECFAFGQIYAPRTLGGLVGEATATTINNSYSRARVEVISDGNGPAGGILGNPGLQVLIKNTYSTGEVIGEIISIGGLTGSEGGTTLNSFWDMETSGQESSPGGTGKTPEQMKNPATYTDIQTEGLEEVWDFFDMPETGVWDIWAMDENRNDGYPYLNWQYPNRPSIFIENIEKIEEGTITFKIWITQSGGTSLTQKGVVWSIAENPDVTDFMLIQEEGEDRFTIEVSPENASQLYHFKAFAENSEGISYSESIPLRSHFQLGEGTDENPFKLQDAYDFLIMSFNPEIHDLRFEQTHDVDMSPTHNYFNKKGFIPIPYFSGVFNGNEHEIKNMRINTPKDSEVALFAVAWGAEIKNVSIADAEIKGVSEIATLVGHAHASIIDNIKVTNSRIEGEKTGGVAGKLSATILSRAVFENGRIDFVPDNYGWIMAGGIAAENISESSITEAKVINTNIYGYQNIGGIAGFNDALIVSGSFEGSINAQADNVGGIAGRMGINGMIKNSESNALITGVAYVGGIAGHMILGGGVSKSYSIGNIEAHNNVGGIVGGASASAVIENSYSHVNQVLHTGVAEGSYGGGLAGSISSNVLIQDCYSTGTVTSGNHTGGLVGFSNLTMGEVRNSFWDTEASERPFSATGTGKTTTEMQNIETFTLESTTGLDLAWDFLNNPNDDTDNEEVWHIDAAVNNGYPYLTWQYLPQVITYQTSEVAPQTATASGEIVTEGASPITGAGLVWSTNEIPLLTEGHETVTTGEIESGLFELEMTNLDSNTEYFYRAFATNSYGSMYGSIQSFFTDKQSQTISFAEPADATYGDEPIELTASSDSELPISFELSEPDIAEIEGHQLTIKGAGQLTIIATQEGNDIYEAAEPVQHSLDIAKASLLAGAQDKTKSYGDANPIFSFEYSGFVYNDDESSIDIEPIATTVADENSPVGQYPIVPEGGADANYIFSFQSGTLHVEKAILGVSVENAEKAYGEPIPQFSLTYSGFVNEENEENLDALPTIHTEATQFSPTGTYVIWAEGGEAPNYDFEFFDGALDIVKATLNIYAENAQMYYGHSLPGFELSAPGLVGQDVLDDLDALPNISTTATQNSLPGNYPINLDGGYDNNYEILLHNGILTIDKAPLTVRADDKERMYQHANPPFTLSYEGFVLDQEPWHLDQQPYAHSDADSHSDAGQYEIQVLGGESSTYELIRESGMLTILKVDQSITWFDFIGTLYVDDNPYPLNAGTDSGLEPEFRSSDPNIAYTEDGYIHPVAAGWVTITAYQDGNQNYEPAEDWGQEVEIMQATFVHEGKVKNISIYPLPANREICIRGLGENLPQYSIKNTKGIRQAEGQVHGSCIDINFLTPGVYLLILNNNQTFKFVKQ